MIAIGALLLLAACEKPSTEAYVRATEKLALIVERHERDCTSMGRALKRFIEKEGGAIRDYQAHQNRLPKKHRAKLEARPYGPRLRRAMERMVPGHQRCLEHDAVREAFLLL